jgi:predicted alpha/beta superfamily hydrolase
MKKFVKSFLLVLALLISSEVYCVLFAQERHTISDSIYSNILKEQRSIKVLLPETYKPGSNDKYEVIFITDGEWAMDPFSFVYKWAQDENYVPPAILIAIPNRYIDKKNQRDRDFLPVHVSELAISGGADNFLSFIKNELIPYIDDKYPSNKTYSIYGHSYGGLFSLYALLKEPQLFSTYYATDPPFGWNNDYLIKMAAEKLENLSSNKVLWLAGITETYKYQGIDRLDSVLHKKASKNLLWQMVTFPNEKHNSVRLKAMYDGIKFAYSGYSTSPIKFHPMNGTLLKDRPYPIRMENYSDMRYTLDGSEPNTNSQKVDPNLKITAPAQLVVKSFSTSGKYDKITRGNFELGETLPSVSNPEKIERGGLKYSYYEGSWDILPDFKTMKPVKTGIADSTFSLNQLPAKTNYACLFEGYLEIVKDGYSVFATVSTGGSSMFLGNKMILDFDGIQVNQNVKSFVLPLEKGFYPVRIEYIHKDGSSMLDLYYLAEGSENPGRFPFKYMYFGN